MRHSLSLGMLAKAIERRLSKSPTDGGAVAKIDPTGEEPRLGSLKGAAAGTRTKNLERDQRD